VIVLAVVASRAYARTVVSTEHTAENLLELLRTLPVPVHVVGPAGEILGANRAELAMLGYRAEDYLGHHVTEFHVDRDVGAAVAERLRRGESLRDIAARLRCADGSVKYTRITSNVWREGDRILQTQCFTQDVTEAVAAERRLAVQYRVAQTLTAKIDATVALRRTLAAVCEELGWDVGEVWRRPPDADGLRLVAAVARPGVDADALALLGHEATLARGVDLPGHVWAGGEPVWLADLAKAPIFQRAAAADAAGLRVACGVPIALGDEETSVMVGLRREPEAGDEVAAVRTLRLVAAQLEQFLGRQRIEHERACLLARERAVRLEAETANRAKDEFLAAVSHELRTPLNAILGWSRLLRSGQLDAATVERGLAAVERNAEIQEQLIADLLDVARIVTGKVQLRLAPTDLAGVVDAAVDAVRHTAAAKGQVLAVHVERPVPPTLADADRLQQVVCNLLSNAIRFTPEGGHVGIGLHVRDGRASIQVTDDGTGIEAAFLPHVFDRFRQAEAGATRRTGGLGLGLAIVRHLTELHGGLVHAASAGAGRGATFTVELPLLVATTTTPAGDGPARPVPDAGALEHVRILLVDDDDDARDLLGMVLRQHGAEVVDAASAEQAVAAFGRATPDVVLSDIGLPDVDGYGLVRRLHGLVTPGTPPAIAVALTGWARPEDRNAALQAGFQAHVVKPIDPVQLVALLAELVQERRPAGISGIRIAWS
jgi:PAS domain S-box-containing protein